MKRWFDGLGTAWRIIGRIASHRFFLAILTVFLIFFAAVVPLQGRWSAWRDGDAQAMNTLRFWKRDGFVFPHMLLFLTQGYSPWIRLFDATDLQEHALSSVYEKDGQLVQRIYYSHFPSLYLVPFIPLVLLNDLSSPLPFQLFQLAVSGLAVLLLYLVIFRLYRSRLAASVVAGVFMLSRLFIQWATTLTNQPIDDVLRYAFILAVLSESGVLAWFLLFGLSMVSLDSIFFCFIWLVGFDLLNVRRLRIRRWFVFGLGPVAARFIQLSQTAVVYGWRDTLLDQSYSYYQRNSLQDVGFFKTRFYIWSMEWQRVLALDRWFNYSNALRQLCFALLVLIVAGLVFIFFRRRFPVGLTRKEIGYPIVLLLAGLAFGGFVPVAGMMPYEGRQLYPFIGAIMALVIVYYRRAVADRKTSSAVIVSAFFLLCAVALFSSILVAGGLATLLQGWQEPLIGTYQQGNPAIKSFTKDLHRIGDNTLTIVFLFDPDGSLIGWNRSNDSTFGYQIGPTYSFEADKLILGFDSEARLISDAGILRVRTDHLLKPLIVGRSAQDVERFASDEWRTNCREAIPVLAAQSVGGWFGVLSPACSH